MDPHADDGQLNALLDGELDASERQAVESHLAACAACRARYAEARAFLAGASDLLGLLDAPPVPVEAGAAPTPKPVVAPSAPRRAAPTAQEPAVVLPGPGVARTAKEKAVDPTSRVARTGKEQAVDIPAIPSAAPTAEVPALPPELPTAKTPAVRPIFPQAQRGEGEPPSGRPWGVSKLAWAAMLIVGVGAGWMANEALRHARPATDLATAAGEGREPVAAADASKAPVSVTPPPAATAAPDARRTAARPALVKPTPMRGGKPPTADEAADRIPRERPTTATRPSELAARSRDAAGAPGAASGAGVTTATPAPSAGVGGLAAAPPPRPSAAATQPARAAARAPAGAAAQPARTAEEAPLTAFRRITMDEAVRRLSGSIRLIDGLQPALVEVGPGRLVPGAAPEREVIRVYYADEAGRSLVLDQQPGETPSATSVNGLMRGDTLVTAQPDGSVRVRWVDRKSFWLSLTGTASADSVRTMVERIR